MYFYRVRSESHRLVEIKMAIPSYPVFIGKAISDHSAGTGMIHNFI
jgi:hypothetical protein